MAWLIIFFVVFFIVMVILAIKTKDETTGLLMMPVAIILLGALILPMILTSGNAGNKEIVSCETIEEYVLTCENDKYSLSYEREGVEYCVSIKTLTKENNSGDTIILKKYEVTTSAFWWGSGLFSPYPHYEAILK